jgi:hypothetical protein
MTGPGGIHLFRVADRQRAEGLADALAAFGFPLVFAAPEGGEWTVVVCDPGPYPPNTAGHRAQDAAYRQATVVARQYGGRGGLRTHCRADRVPTTAPAGTPVVRSNPGSRPAVPVIDMRPAPPQHRLSLTPDVHRPGPLDLSWLDRWLDAAASDRLDHLEHAYGTGRLADLVRQLVDAEERDWNELLWAELMSTIVHQGTCYPATPAMVPVLATLATSTVLPARRRLDLHVALLSITKQETADLIRSAHARPDRPTPRAQPWASHARAAVGAATPALLNRWPHQPPAIQFALATFAALHPEHGGAHTGELDALAADVAGTQPGAYLELATALLHGDQTAAIRHSQEIISWHEDADPRWLEAPDLPAAITCGHLLIQGTLTLASRHE